MTDNDRDRDAAMRPECDRFELELSAYLEGEPRPELERHAATCPYCSVVLADMALIRTEAASLPLETPPARVWANVRAQMAAEGLIKEQASWKRWFDWRSLEHSAAPLGALACLVIFSSVVLLVPSTSMDRSTTASWISLKDRDAMAAHILRVEDGDLASMVGELEKDFNARQGSLAPTVKATYLQGLKSLDDSISECRASVQKEPGNTLAREYLVSAYTQKAEVLAAALKYDVP
jgi:hypothetical protein